MDWPEFKIFAKKRFFAEDEDLLTVCFATLLANRLSSDPVWTCIIGPSGAGKTEAIRIFEKDENCIFRSEINENTIISHWRKTSKDSKDPSLAALLNNKILLFKDLAVLAEKPDVERRKIIAQFRELYDGAVSKHTGRGYTTYKVKCGLLTACTPIIEDDDIWNTTLGARLIYFKMKTSDNDSVSMKVAKNSVKMLKNRKELMEKAVETLNDLYISASINLEQDLLIKINKLSGIVSVLRAKIKKDKYHRNAIVSETNIEVQTRLLSNYQSMFHALSQLEPKKALLITTRLAASTCPQSYMRILTYIFNGYNTIDKLCGRLKISRWGMTDILASLEHLRVLHREKIISTYYYHIDEYYKGFVKICVLGDFIPDWYTKKGKIDGLSLLGEASYVSTSDY